MKNRILFSFALAMMASSSFAATGIADTTQVHGINEEVVTDSLSLLDSTPIPWLTSMRRNMWIMWRCCVDRVINNGYQMPGFTAMGGVKVRF